MNGEEAPVRIPINGELDLHTFSPNDFPALFDSYFEECRARGLFQIRIVHGKGTGTLRTTVHHLLRSRSDIVATWQGDTNSGGWGATWVELKRKSPA